MLEMPVIGPETLSNRGAILTVFWVCGEFLSVGVWAQILAQESRA